MSTTYGALGMFWPIPNGNVEPVARVISGFVGGYGDGFFGGYGAGNAGFPVGGGYWFGSFVMGIVNSVWLSGHLPEYLFLWPLAASGLLFFLHSLCTLVFLW